MQVERVLGLLERVKKSGSGWTACCPAHDDRSPSLSIKEGEDGRVLLHCHAGCEVEAICGALGMGVRDLFMARVSTPRPARSRGKIHESVEAAVRAAGSAVAADDFGFNKPANATKVDLKDLQGMSVLPKHFKRGAAQ